MLKHMNFLPWQSFFLDCKMKNKIGEQNYAHYYWYEVVGYTMQVVSMILSKHTQIFPYWCMWIALDYPVVMVIKLYERS